MKYVQPVRKHFSKKNVFSIRDLKIFLAKQGISRNYTHLLLHNLMKKKEIHRITRGFYTFKDDLEVVGFAFSPFYYGLQEALSLRNLWEQETNPVIITSRKARTGVRKIMDSNVVIRRINRKMFFGFELIKYGDYWLPVSDVEKTLIDFVYFKEPLPKETLKEIKQKIRKKTLNQYLKKAPKQVKKRVKMLLQ